MKDLEKGVLTATNNTDDEWDEDTLKDWREKMSEPIGYEIVADNSNKAKKVTA
ncbi:MAG: hypothetical protein K6C13_09170 [Oscillospiraceae bacterium]|nr:hypothetical protein [Oscillospiraceae bacterium]